MSPTQRKVAIVFLIGVITFLYVFGAGGTPQAYGITVTMNRTIETSGYDGDAWNYYSFSMSGARNATTGTLNYTDNSFTIGVDYPGGLAYYFYRGFTYFDTSILPDNANISSAVLSLYIVNDNSGTSDFNVQIQNGQPTYPHMPMVAGDYALTHYSGNGGATNTSTISAPGWWNITLSTMGKTWINKTSTTKLCLRSSLDISGATWPDPGLDYNSIDVGSAENAQAAKLYLTYTVANGYRYIVHGPYYENGNVYPGIVNLTLFQTTVSPLEYVLNGSDGSADILTVETEAIPSYFSWNVSNPDLNFTRTFFLWSDFEEVWIYIPDPGEVFGYYSFTVHDLRNVTDAYLESHINVGGADRIVERQSLNVVNDVLFVMTWAHRYGMVLVCNLGTHSYGDFIPLTETNQELYILPSYFPTATENMQVIVNATRDSDGDTITMMYYDPSNQTSWVQFNVKYQDGLTWTTFSTTNNTGNSQGATVNDVGNTTDYLANIKAKWNGTVYEWNYPLPANVTAGTELDAFWSFLGVLPFETTNLFGFIIVALTVGYGSYEDQHFAFFVALCEVAFLMAIGWFSIGYGSMALAFTVVLLIWVIRGKERS